MRTWLLMLAMTTIGCTTLRVATPQQAADLDDLEWHVERTAPPAPPPAAAPPVPVEDAP